MVVRWRRASASVGGAVRRCVAAWYSRMGIIDPCHWVKLDPVGSSVIVPPSFQGAADLGVSAVTVGDLAVGTIWASAAVVRTPSARSSRVEMVVGMTLTLRQNCP
jgi:hypothetical protein